MSNLSSQGLKYFFDEQYECDAVSTLFDTVSGSLTGFIPGRPRINHINAGRGSNLQVFRQMYTKAKKKKISKMKLATARKMGQGAFYQYAVAQGAAAGGGVTYLQPLLSHRL